MVALGENVQGAERQAIETKLAEIGQLIDSNVDVRQRKSQMRSALEEISVFLISQEARVRTEDLS